MKKIFIFFVFLFSFFVSNLFAEGRLLMCEEPIKDFVVNYFACNQIKSGSNLPDKIQRDLEEMLADTCGRGIGSYAIVVEAAEDEIDSMTEKEKKEYCQSSK